MNNEWNAIIEASDKIVKHSTNLFTYITEPKRKADEFLYSVISEKGELNDEDLKKAALILHVHKLHKRLKNYYKIIQESEKEIKKNKTAQTSIPEDDWLEYFEELSSKVSDDTLQKIWAQLLTKERLNSGSVSKVMLNTFSLLDKNSAVAFGKLCCLTYKMKIEDSDLRIRYIPLLLYSDITSKIINKHKKQSHSKEGISYLEEYQTYLPTQQEIEYLSELNLVKLSEIHDESEVYSLNPMNITFSANGFTFETTSLYDNVGEYYFINTGQAFFTQTGFTLYQALSMEPKPFLYKVLKEYIVYTANN